MSCIHTFTNHSIDPCNPKKEQIFIEDIAHALSVMCRAGGHFPQFYSVAQHCISCCHEAEKRGFDKRIQLLCLLHDASEAYIADITRPVKKNLPDYLVYEKRLQNLIYEKFSGSFVNEEEEKIIAMIDDAMLCNEFIHFTGKNLFQERIKIFSEVDYSFAMFDVVEKEYLSCFKKLYD